MQNHPRVRIHSNSDFLSQSHTLFHTLPISLSLYFSSVPSLCMFNHSLSAFKSQLNTHLFAAYNSD